jgi:hypothetical protein
MTQQVPLVGYVVDALKRARDNGGYARAREDASHLGVGPVMGASGCMNIRAHLVSAMPASAADQVLALAEDATGFGQGYILARCVG